MNFWAFTSAALALSVIVTAVPSYAGNLAGIAVGEPLSSASEKLRRLGEFSTMSGASGDVYIAGDYIVVGCNGRVWGVTRSLSPSFRAFTASAKRIELEQRAAPAVEITSDDGREELSMVELRWNLGDGSTRKLTYIESRSSTGVSESVQQSTFCSS